MNWTQTIFIGERSSGQTDGLGNAIVDSIKLGEYPSRFTEWTSAEVSSYGRDFTESYRKMLTRASESVCKGTVSIRVDDTFYKIKERIGDDKTRFRILYLYAAKV